MKKLIFCLAIALSGSVIARSETAFNASNMEASLVTSPIAVGDIVEVPDSFETSNIVSEYSKAPVILNRAYAGKETWGSLCNITDNLSDPDYNGERSWTINLVNLETGTTEKIFTSTRKRKIQSVVCSPFDGVVGALFSMKESASGDYEIYQLVPDASPPFTKLTDNDTDDVDVTSSWNNSTIAWQHRLADGRQAIQLIRFGSLSPQPSALRRSVTSEC